LRNLLTGSCHTGPRLMVWPVPDADAGSLPRTFRDVVRAEFGRALRPPYATLSTVAANAAFMSLAWFLLPRALEDDVFTLHGSLAFALVLAAWMYADVPATNVLAPDRQRVMAAIDDPVILRRLLYAKNIVLRRSPARRSWTPGGPVSVPSGFESSSSVSPRPKSAALKKTHGLVMSVIVTSIVVPSSILIVSARLPDGKSLPVRAPDCSRKLTRTFEPVPGTPPSRSRRRPSRRGRRQRGRGGGQGGGADP
jgi:hypothetical protein